MHDERAIAESIRIRGRKCAILMERFGGNFSIQVSDTPEVTLIDK